MVSWSATLFAQARGTGGSMLSAAEEKAEPLLMRLDPQSRAKVVMALLGLVLVGVALVVMVITGRRLVVRIARRSYQPTPTHEDDWYRKPLVPKRPEEPPSGPSE